MAIVWYIFFFCISFLLIFIFNVIGVGILQSFLYAYLLVIGIYLTIAIVRLLLMRHILDEACDPMKYLKRISKQKLVMKRKPKVLALLSINEAAAYMLMGEYRKAKVILAEVDQDYLSDKNATLLIYTINYICCCYELGDLDEAARLFDTQIPLLAPPTKLHRRLVKLLIGERYFFLGQYDECYQHMSALMDIELNRRQQLGILYRLAQIDRIRGNEELATKKFQKIVKYGNKLWIAEEADRMLKTI